MGGRLWRLTEAFLRSDGREVFAHGGRRMFIDWEQRKKQRRDGQPRKVAVRFYRRLKDGEPVPDDVLHAFSEYLDARGLRRCLISQIAEPVVGQVSNLSRGPGFGSPGASWCECLTGLFLPLSLSDAARCRTKADFLDAAQIILRSMARHDGTGLRGKRAAQYGERVMRRSAADFARWLEMLCAANQNAVLFAIEEARGVGQVSNLPRGPTFDRQVASRRRTHATDEPGRLENLPHGVVSSLPRAPEFDKSQAGQTRNRFLGKRIGVSVAAALTDAAYSRLRDGQIEDFEILRTDLVPRGKSLFVAAVAENDEYDLRKGKTERAMLQTHTVFNQLALVCAPIDLADTHLRMLTIARTKACSARLRASAFQGLAARTPQSRKPLFECAWVVAGAPPAQHRRTIPARPSAAHPNELKDRLAHLALRSILASYQKLIDIHGSETQEYPQ